MQPALLARSAVPRFVVSPAVSAFHTSAKRLQAQSAQTVITPSSGNAYNSSSISGPNKNKKKKDRLRELKNHCPDLGRMAKNADMLLLNTCSQDVSC